MQSATLHFRVNAEIKDIVGRDLINDDNIAIIELIKNAYDANSHVCNIIFNNEDDENLKESSLIIQDFGQGMDKADIINKWLNIAYSEKKDSINKGKRHFSGNKGVGRFSCDRLGKNLKLYSRKNESNQYVYLNIEWPDFEGQGKDTEISSIPIQFEEISDEEFKSRTGLKSFLHGTYLIISHLRTHWDREKLIALRRSLERFINPHQAFDASSFKISLIVPSQIEADRKITQVRKKVNGDIANTIFNELGLKTSYINSMIDETGSKIITTLYHRGERLFTLTEKNSFKKLKNIKISVYFLNQYHKAYFNRETGITSVDYGSIFLFLNGFRVPPYGERYNDWLGLDNRKTQGTRRYLGTRDIMGRVEITDPDNSWRVISSREGIVHTDAYTELTDSRAGAHSYFYSILKKLERYVVDGLRWDSTKESWSAINEKVFSSKNIDISESYSLDEDIKNIQVMNLLQSIILQGTEIENIISIDFDFSILKLLFEQEEQKIQDFFLEFNKFIYKFENKPNFNSLTQIKNFLTNASFELENFRKQRDVAHEELHNAKEALLKTSNRNKILVQENLFLKAQRNRDIDDVINLHHQVVTWSQIISKNCDIIIKKLKKNGDKLFDFFGTIILIRQQASKILKVAKLATNANFRVKAININGDIISFIHDYINEINKTNLFKGVNIKFLSRDNWHPEIVFTPIEITILIDIIISNSKKATASLLTITSTIDFNNKLINIVFDDNGNGLSPHIEDPASIFNRGITTTDGSGIGLHYAKNIIEKLGGKLSITQSRYDGFALKMEVPYETGL